MVPQVQKGPLEPQGIVVQMGQREQLAKMAPQDPLGLLAVRGTLEVQDRLELQEIPAK